MDKAKLIVMPFNFDVSNLGLKLLFSPPKC